MKFLVDMPLSPELVPWLIQQKHEAAHVLDLGLDRSPDEALIARAREENWIIVTADLDFPHQLALTGEVEPGVILFRGGNYSESEMRALLERILQTVPFGELAHSVVVVDQYRIRRRRLPLR